MREGDAVLFNFDLRHINANVWYTNVCHAPPQPQPRLTFWYICRGNFIQLHLLEHKSSVILCQSKASVVSRGQSRYGHAHAAFSFQLSLRHMFNKLTHTRFLCTVLSGCVCARVCVCASVMARQSKLHCADTRN